jgi:protein O-GlcNAc transferase
MIPTKHISCRDSKDVENGALLLNQGRPLEALKLFERALALNPRDALGWYNAGVACHCLKTYPRAVVCYHRAVQCLPDFVEAFHNLGQAHAAQKEFRLAIEAYQKALRLDPADFKSAFNMGVIHRTLGHSQNAAAAMQAAIRANPNSAEAFCMLAMIYLEQNRMDEALVCLEQALYIDPHLAEAHYNQGIAYQKSGRFEDSLGAYRRALICKPDFAPARWLLELSLPMLYDRPEHIEQYRRRFRINLDGLIGSTALHTAAQKAYALKGVATTTNFYLQYQCRNDLALQIKYGRFVHRVMAANFPQWAAPRIMPLLEPGEKIRIGYVSTYMCDHTVGTFLSGWLESHNPSDFEIHSYHVGPKVDDVTRRLRGLSRHFGHFPGDMEAAARRIDADNLHILIHTDIGMDPITTQLAALRLAPIQCKGWGHPVTTGLPTIDYYLSSDLMEPEQAEAFYSESLVRLPNLALCCRPPKLPAKPKTRMALGLPEDRFIYLSTQSIFKYLPQHDDIFPRIARAVPRACFVFIGHQSAAATARFRKRLQSAFASLGLDADRFCHFQKKLNFSDFLSLNLAADVLLDTLEWSGGKTTLEALACGLPVVTVPGRFMRGRHAYAMLRMIDVTATIAQDKAAYCAIAARLAQDPAFLAGIKARIAENRPGLYHDRTFMTCLEAFVRSVVHGAAAEARPASSIS